MMEEIEEKLLKALQEGRLSQGVEGASFDDSFDAGAGSGVMIDEDGVILDD